MQSYENHRRSAAGTLISAPGWLLAVCVIWAGVCVQPVSAQTRTNYWTGAASADNNWSTAGNWSLLEAPAEGDRVIFGNEPGGVAQVITLDVEPTINDLWITATNSAYTLQAVGNEQLTLTAASSAVTMSSAAEVNATLDVYLYASTGTGNIINQSLAARLILGPNGVFSSAIVNPRVAVQGPGFVEVQGQFPGITRFNNGARVIAANETGDLITSRYYPQNNTVLYLAKNTTMGGRILPSGSGITSDIRIIDSGSEDRTIAFLKNRIYGSATDVIRVGGSPDGSSGHLTLKLYWIDVGSLAFETTADATIEFASHATSTTVGGMYSADNPGVFGEGNVRLKRAASDISFGIAREMTYTGRTMLDTGILQLNAGGALPTNTIVEIGSSAAFNLNGHASLVGGLSDYEGTAGQVLLNGGTLTVHAQVNSGFSGTFASTGAVIKAGAATLTLAAGYTNIADRTLRIEDGLLEVTGGLSVAAGTFELAGGSITAETLAAEGMTWDVTLTAGQEAGGYQIVAVDEADIKDGQLVVRLAEGFQPDLETTFTLLYAGTGITGDNAGTWFGYQDGDEISGADGSLFRLNALPGSESLQLTLIPEPGSLALLGLAIAALAAFRRRRG